MLVSIWPRTVLRLMRAPAAALAVVAVVMVMAAGSPARAALELRIQSVAANANSTGNAFDVTLLNNNSSSVTLSAFSFGLIVASTDITFQDVTTATSLAPYVFAGNSLFGPIITVAGAGTQAVSAEDLYAAPGGFATLAANAEVGLGHVFFDVKPGASGTYTVSFVSSLTGLTNGSLQPITGFTTSTGTIRIASTAVVPEPATVVSAGIGLALLGVSRLIGRRRSVRKAGC
jgi:hypothetical protein